MTVPAKPPGFDPKKEYEENPFLKGFRVPIRRKRATIGEPDEVIVSTTTGEITESPVISRSYDVDAERFVKLYIAQIGVFFSLPQRALRLAEVLLHEMSRLPGTDMVYLNRDAAEKYFASKGQGPGLSKVTYHRALLDLLNAGLLAYSDRPGLFFLNPHVFFNGDRVKFVTEYRRKKKREFEALEKAGQQRLDFEGAREPEKFGLPDEDDTGGRGAAREKRREGRG